MRNMALYPKLALQNIRSSRKFYLPYILALMGDVAAMYIMSALVNDPGVKNMTPGHPNGYMYVEVFMSIGMMIAFLFSTVFVLYINGFLMKQRKKELGLYNILGMGKRHIAMVLIFETLYIAATGIGGGLAVGLLLHKLVSLMIHKVLGMPVPFGAYISWTGIAHTSWQFAGLLAVTLLCNLYRVRVSKPIELLRGGSMGEREPKTRWLLTFLGIAALTGGYYIAVNTKTGVEAIMMYFVAVFLVIVGTYCLFTAVSIFVLKLLRNNKKFYYQTSHFIGVSGMLYRMKQNAVGLANICILCTMVMVMISGTLSLYLGTAEIVERQCPGDVTIEVRYSPENGEEPFHPDGMLAVQTQYIENGGYSVSNVRTSRELTFGVGQLADGSYTTDRFNQTMNSTVISLTAITEADYTTLTGQTLGLAPGEIAAYGAAVDQLTIRWTAPKEGREISTTVLPVARRLNSNPCPSPMITQTITLVVPDEEMLSGLCQKQAEVYGESASSLCWSAYLDVDCSSEELETLYDGYVEAISTPDFYAGSGAWSQCSYRLKSEGAADAYGLAGGFLFLGIFLGFLFLLATVLIIYYKQISEGYEDKDRFEIMQKVGLSKEEVRASIRSQVLLVFFLPIAVAAIHILFDFNMVEKLLTLFSLQNTALTAICTAGTVLVFFAVYGAVYLLTARTYYRIVERKQ